MRNAKGRKSTKGMVIADDVIAGPGKGATNADMVEYTPTMVLHDLHSIKHRIKKATYNGRDLNQLAKVFTVEALTVIVQCIQDVSCNMSDRLRASEILLNRGWGKAKEHVQVDSATHVVIDAPDIMAMINARRAQAIDNASQIPDGVYDAEITYEPEAET